MCVVKIVELRDHLESGLERGATLDVVADTVQHHKRGVAFVEMPGGWLDAHRLERSHAADAEDDLLLDSRLAIAAVEARRELAIPGRVLFEIRIEEKELDAAEEHLPHGREDGTVAERHGDDAGAAIGANGLLDGRVGPVEPHVRFLLPAFLRHGLVKVPLRIHEADADERHAEVARFLAVVSGEHAKAAGIDRKRLVQRELGGEVGDRTFDVGEALVPPRIVRRARRVKTGDGLVVELQEPFVLRPLLQDVRRDQAQHEHRVVRRLAPQRVVEPAEDLARPGVPRPPQIVGELGQTTKTFGYLG